MVSKKKIIITGANGVIGQVLQGGLTDYQITPLDLPVYDLTDYEAFSQTVSSEYSAIIHLAWDKKHDNPLGEGINPANAQMFFNVYKSALEKGVTRVIMASSVHADRFYNFKGPGFLTPDKVPNPEIPYGSYKVFMESVGKAAALKGLEVVCIRFGGVTKDNTVSKLIPQEKAVFLDHQDCVSLVKAALEAESIPNNFVIVYGVSNNKGRIHDFSNPFNWIPQDLV